MKRHLTLLALTLGSPLACTGFEPGSDVLGSDQGENLPAAAPGEDWSCLEGAELRENAALPTVSSAATRLIYSGQIVDLSTGAIYPDMRVRACGFADIDCATPVADNLPLDGSGWVDVPLFEGFTGFFEFSSPAVLSTIFFLPEPVLVPTRNEQPFVVVSRASVPPLLQLVGLTAQPDTGFLAIRARDCRDISAPGVTFSIEGGGTQFYFIGGLPTPDAEVTDAAGLGGVANMPVGRAVISATTRDGMPIMAPQTILIREGWLSELIARPPLALRATEP